PLTAATTAPDQTRNFAISREAGTALSISTDVPDAVAKLKSALADRELPKAIHDSKTAAHVLDPQDFSLSGVEHDTMLYSYLLDPTYSSHRLADVALRRFNLKLTGTLPESADVTGRLATTLRREVETSGLVKLYQEIDLPLVAVLTRMEDAGVKIDLKVLAAMSSRLEREIDKKSKAIYE
ncbi:MAG: polymerase, partial [Acidobacteriaceae bacterium]